VIKTIHFTNVTPKFTAASSLVLIALLTGCAISPNPLSESERQKIINDDKIAMYLNQEKVNAPITLEEAMARALKYNLDNRLKLMEQALSQHQLDIANFNMLPQLAANAGYFARDNDAGSTSMDLTTGERLDVSSTSVDKRYHTADLSFSWNVLDFGASYFQAKQQADQTLILEERRRKVVQVMLQQVRQAYWQAVGAQQLEQKINAVMQSAEQALSDSRTAERERLRSPLDSLNYQRQLLDVIRQLEAIRDELLQAKPRLASIMNLPPNEDFKLTSPSQLLAPSLMTDLVKMEELALLNRPELVEAQYQERISLQETRKAISRLFPGIEFSAGPQYDSNSFLVNNDWNAASVRVSWNLLNVLNIQNTRAAAKAQVEVARSQRLALNMAVLTQVHVSYREFINRKHQFERSNDMFGVDQRILSHTRNAARSSADSKLQEIRASASALMSELRLYQSYGALQSSYGQILATLGVDLLPQELPSHDLVTLSKAVQDAQKSAERNFSTNTTAAVSNPAPAETVDTETTTEDSSTPASDPAPEPAQ
jgi:outer membrane protein TolC